MGGRLGGMVKFRKKPVVIEAERWDGSNINLIRMMTKNSPIHYVGDRLGIETLEGVMFASPGDWIIKGVKGEFYPCKPDIFEATYEPVEEQ